MEDNMNEKQEVVGKTNSDNEMNENQVEVLA